jgi:hypothetical protein
LLDASVGPSDPENGEFASESKRSEALKHEPVKFSFVEEAALLETSDRPEAPGVAARRMRMRASVDASPEVDNLQESSYRPRRKSGLKQSQALSRSERRESEAMLIDAARDMNFFAGDASGPRNFDMSFLDAPPETEKEDPTAAAIAARAKKKKAAAVTEEEDPLAVAIAARAKMQGLLQMATGESSHVDDLGDKRSNLEDSSLLQKDMHKPWSMGDGLASSSSDMPPVKQNFRMSSDEYVQYGSHADPTHQSAPEPRMPDLDGQLKEITQLASRTSFSNVNDFREARRRERSSGNSNSHPNGGRGIGRRARDLHPSDDDEVGAERPRQPALYF